MNMPSEPDFWDSMSQIAYRSGPFFFSLIFLFFVTGKAHSWFQVVNNKTTPTNSVEFWTYWGYFVLSVLSGFFLVGLSVWWYFHVQSVKHVLEIEINNFELVGELHGVGDRNMIRQSYEHFDKEKAINYKNFKFIFLRDTPFKKGEKLHLQYYSNSDDVKKNGTGEQLEKPKDIWVRLTEERASMRMIFHAALDPGGQVVLTPINR